MWQNVTKWDGLILRVAKICPKVLNVWSKIIQKHVSWCFLVEDEWPEALQSHSAVGFEVAESPLESRRNFTGDPSANSEVHLWSLWMQRKVVTMEPRNRAKRWQQCSDTRMALAALMDPKKIFANQINPCVIELFIRDPPIIHWHGSGSLLYNGHKRNQYAGHIPKTPGSSYNQQTFSKCSGFQQPTSASLFAWLMRDKQLGNNTGSKTLASIELIDHPHIHKSLLHWHHDIRGIPCPVDALKFWSASEVSFQMFDTYGPIWFTKEDFGQTHEN